MLRNTAIVALVAKFVNSFGTFAAIFAAFTAAAALIFQGIQYREKTRQDKRDLRWRQVEAAMRMVDQALADTAAFNGILMVTVNEMPFSIPADAATDEAPRAVGLTCIGLGDLVRALRVFDANLTNEDQFIRTALHRLFFWVDRIWTAVELEYVLRKDVEPQLSTWLRRAATHPDFCDAAFVYLEEMHMRSAKQLLSNLADEERRCDAKDVAT
jgi:hypothetical protein